MDIQVVLLLAAKVKVVNIDCIVTDKDKRWRFTGFYGNLIASLRHHSWSLLEQLNDIIELKDLSWLVGGDINEICFDSEKLGGNLRLLLKCKHSEMC